jgi:signal transduction histidine kinase
LRSINQRIMRLLLLLFVVCMLLFACRQNSSQEKVLLNRADSLMENYPDSALNLLRTLSTPQKLPTSDRAFYALLMIQAVDKCDLYDQHTESDSLIGIAINYYTHSHNAEKAAYAYFYLSRCEHNRGNAKGQAEALLNAIPYAVKSNSNKLLGFIYGEKAAIYNGQQNNLFNSFYYEKSEDTTLFEIQQRDSMLYYNRLSLLAFQKAKDKRNSVISMLDIGDNYYQLHRYDSALCYCRMAEREMFSMYEPPLLTTIYRLMTGIFFEQKKYDIALHYIRLSMQTSDALDYDKWQIFAKICIQINALDSARLYLNKCILSGNELPDCYQLLQEIAEKQGNPKEALHYAKLATAAKDSVAKRSLADSFAGMEKKFNYERITIENKQLIIRNQRYLMSILLALFFCFILTAFFFIERNHKRKLALLEKNLRKTVATKDKFFSIISHDLRNPSHSLRQLSELLYQRFDSMDKPQVIALLKLLSDTAKQNYKLIENLLFWAITQQQDFPFNPVLFDIREVIESSIDMVYAEAELKTISIETNLQHNVQVYADRKMIETVLRNLLNNAIKFSQAHQKVIIETLETTLELKVNVVDHGVGMDPEEMERLFHVDSKLKREGTDGEKGTGLGLILCAEFIRKNNGKISVQSIKNKGTIVTFVLPKQ